MSVKRTPGPGAKRLQNILHGISKDCSAKVGFFPSAKYPDGTPVAYVAAIQEFGHGPIPPRPFMRTTIDNDQNSWRSLLKTQMQTLANGKTVKQVLTILASTVEGGIAKSITKVTDPPLKQSTIDRRFHSKKGSVSTKPLVDTRLMFDSVTSVVEDNT